MFEVFIPPKFPSNVNKIDLCESGLAASGKSSDITEKKRNQSRDQMLDEDHV